MSIRDFLQNHFKNLADPELFNGSVYIKCVKIILNIKTSSRGAHIFYICKHWTQTTLIIIYKLYTTPFSTFKCLTKMFLSLQSSSSALEFIVL